jgi:hypothetical protein
VNSLNLNISNATLLWLRQKIYARNSHANTSLLALPSQLNSWNIERISANNMRGQSQDLSIEDVHALKEIIHVAVNKSAVKNADVMSDQMLFFVIGAIQIQAQNGSDDAWKLVNRSIQSLAKPAPEKRPFAISFAAIALIVCVFAMVNFKATMQPAASVPQAVPPTSIVGVTDPVTISMLVLAYNKMKAGTCQLPQAAMLPIEQRQAFLAFINAGIVDVHSVKDLRMALGYVNCLYPQELMRPVPPVGNSI